MSYFASARIAANPADVVAHLMRVAELPQWNPAISQVKTRDAVGEQGKPYAVTIRGVLPARLVFVSFSSTAVNYTLSGFGASETGEWRLKRASDATTVVTHEFWHHGVLLDLMANAFANVAEWRVGRLKQLVERAN